MRLKAVRDGVEDFELLTIAAAQRGREAVRMQVEPFFRSAWDFEDDHDLLQTVRAAVGRSV